MKLSDRVDDLATTIDAHLALPSPIGRAATARRVKSLAGLRAAARRAFAIDHKWHYTDDGRSFGAVTLARGSWRIATVASRLGPVADLIWPTELSGERVERFRTRGPRARPAAVVVHMLGIPRDLLERAAALGLRAQVLPRSWHEPELTAVLFTPIRPPTPEPTRRRPVNSYARPDRSPPIGPGATPEETLR